MKDNRDLKGQTRTFLANALVEKDQVRGMTSMPLGMGLATKGLAV
jgi:hypothetical protein